jgi:hypothetical protein
VKVPYTIIVHPDLSDTLLQVQATTALQAQWHIMCIPDKVL